MIEDAVYTLLSTNNAILNTVGERIRPLSANQLDLRPFIVFNVNAGGDIVGDSAGPSLAGTNTYQRTTVEVVAYADSYADCIDLQKSIKTACKVVGINDTAANIRIASMVYSEETDIEQSVIPGTDETVYVRATTFRVLFRDLV